MKKIIEINLQIAESKVIGNSKEEIVEFLNTVVLPTILDGLTERSRDGEAGCSVSDHGWECHGTIRF